MTDPHHANERTAMTHTHGLLSVGCYDGTTIMDANGRLVATAETIEDAQHLALRYNTHPALLAACEDMVRKFEDGWPSHATGSVGGLGHTPGDDDECAACRMMPAYESARAAIAATKQGGG